MTSTSKVRELRLTYAPTLVTHDKREPCNTPSRAAAVVAPFLRDEPVEVYMVLLLDTKYRVLAVHTVSRGSLNETIVHPREVFRPAIVAGAAAIIGAHNHPSGDPTPSPDDHQIALRLNDAGRLLGIEVLDHLIIGDAGFTAATTPGRVYPCPA